MNRLFILIFMVSLAAGFGQANMAYGETLTLTTYYPSPFGVYDRFRLVPRAALPDSECNANTVGTLYVNNANNSIEYCQNNTWDSLGVWTQQGNNVYPNDFANASLRVGIGTNTPGRQLHATGDIRADGRYYFGDSQNLYGNTAAALIYLSNHDTATQFQFRDRQGTVYGNIYGAGDGRYFGLLDGDGNWSLLLDKDAATEFRINNNRAVRITDGNLNVYPLTGNANEGGQINLLGAGSRNPWYIDNYVGSFRIFHSGRVYFQMSPTGAINLRANNVNFAPLRVQYQGGAAPGYYAVYAP